MTEFTPPLPTPPELRALKARAHGLDPVVLVGDKGLSGAVLAEIELALAAHELIKVRVEADRGERRRLLDEICGRTSAAAVQHIGKVLVLYRRKPPPPPELQARKSASRRPDGKPAVRKYSAARAPAPRAGKFAPRSAGRPRAAGGPGRPRRASTLAPSRTEEPRRPTGTARRESRSVSPRRGPERPPGRRRTSR